MQPALRSLVTRRSARAFAASAQCPAAAGVQRCSRTQECVRARGLAGPTLPRPAGLALGCQAGRVRGKAAAAGDFEEVRSQVQELIDANTGKFGSFKETKEMDLSLFQDLFSLLCPGMGREEIRALFLSMDASNDGSIQDVEIFSDITMSIVRNRMSHPEMLHPMEGSYYCLPSPPFYQDPRQLAAVKVLRVVYDEVLAAHLKPIPAVAPSVPKKPVPPKESAGIFASFFGGVRRTKPGAKPTPAPVPVAAVPRPAGPKGAYLYGGCGCGKTVLLDLFFRSLPDGFTARRLHWHEFIRDAFRAMQGHPPGDNVFESMGEALARQFRVLLLDELHITHISEAILVKNLFRQLWARGVTVITTSNYRPEELYARGFNRDQFEEFIPELAAQCPVFDMGGETDYRKVDNAESERFLYPLTEDTSAGMDRLFREQVGDTLGTDLDLPILQEKRSIKVPQHGVDSRGARVARFSFEDLCVRNMGRADYSTIAEHFHTVFVDGVPKFRPDLGAEFRRFVSLTDIAYGKKVELYIQSEVHTDELFAASFSSPDVDIDELWAFRRCSSMLSEMQNKKYSTMVWLMRNHLLQESAMKL